MICPKCGHELKDGNMYCEVCGEEIHIVPDFEPEIENSMSDVLSDVADQIDPSRLDNKKEVEHIHFLTDTIDISDDVLIIPKSFFIKIFSFLIILIVAAIIFIGVNIYRDNSYDYQIKCGDTQLAKGNYDDAIDYYEKAYKLDKNNIEALKRIASTYENFENLSRAEEIYRKIIDINGDMYSVEALINLLINDQNYSEASEVILNFSNDEIKEKYKMYIAPVPTFSLDSGTYEEKKLLELSLSGEGKIFYTLDGSEPGSDCNLYEEPILLRNGNYNVSAIFVNDYGVMSEIVNRKYEIHSNVPDNPVVNLAEGKYDVPQLIRVTTPVNSNVYYSTDGTDPTINSAIYTDPIALPLGDSIFKFVSIDENENTSDIIECKYTLEVETQISQQEAIDLVAHRQFEIGRVVSLDGTVPGSDGKYMYSFSELRYIQNKTMYLVSEYYQEGTIRMVTGNLFAVDVYDGTIYQAVAASNNSYTLHNF